jgi:hypothetical protein
LELTTVRISRRGKEAPEEPTPVDKDRLLVIEHGLREAIRKLRRRLQWDCRPTSTSRSPSGSQAAHDRVLRNVIPPGDVDQELCEGGRHRHGRDGGRLPPMSAPPTCGM